MAMHKLKYNPSQLTQEQLRQIIELQKMLGAADFDLSNFMSIINMVIDRVREYTFATGAAVELVEGNETIYSVANGSLLSFIGKRLNISAGLSGLCVQSGEIVISENIAKEARAKNDCKQIKAASMVAVPLSRKDRAFGVLKVISDRPDAFDEYHLYTLQLMAGLLEGALGQQLEIHHKQQMEGQLRQQAQYDSLTGLPNRALFNDRLAHSIARHKRSDTHFALMYMDIDHFKSINDTYGHGVGDLMLKEFASRINQVVRTSDTFARLGGDEFILIAENLKSAKEAKHIAGKIIEALQPIFDLKGHKINVHASIGIALSSGKYATPDAIIHEADVALYKMKKAGRNGFKIAES